MLSRSRVWQSHWYDPVYGDLYSKKGWSGFTTRTYLIVCILGCHSNSYNQYFNSVIFKPEETLFWRYLLGGVLHAPCFFSAIQTSGSTIPLLFLLLTHFVDHLLSDLIPLPVYSDLVISSHLLLSWAVVPRVWEYTRPCNSLSLVFYFSLYSLSIIVLYQV